MPATPPRLLADASVASDFRDLAQNTWRQFLAVFSGRHGCFGDVTLVAARAMESRGAYDPGSARVTVRVPGTAAMLRSALVHEWAHHVEFQCEQHISLRARFLAAQGLPVDTPWRPAGTSTQRHDPAWQDIPSEQYAEATIALVLGGRPIPTHARFTREAMLVIADWAVGD